MIFCLRKGDGAVVCVCGGGPMLRDVVLSTNIDAYNNAPQNGIGK